MSPDHDRGRPDADDILDRVVEDARHEVERGVGALGISALFAGFTMGATPVAYAAAIVLVPGTVGKLVAALVYPVGYVAAILGRAHLFTENTLYPVLLTLSERRYLGATARLWGIVLLGNLLGAVAFAAIAVLSPALPDEIADAVAKLGVDAVQRSAMTTFWAAVLAGWLLALVAWLVEAAQAAIGVIAVIWALTFVVGVLQLDHSIATAIEVWAAVLRGDVGIAAALGWQGLTVAGNAAGGVLIVSLLQFGQVRSEDG